MSHQVFRYNNKDEYLDVKGTYQGKAVSKKFDGFDEAAKMRDILAEGDSGYFYGIKHYSRVVVVDTNINIRENKNNG